jgi:tetratricopeptide (TPR) repeat protein
MQFMFLSPLLRVLSIILLFGMGGCATGQVPVTPYFEMPPERLSSADFELYNRALEQLKNNQLDNSIDLWNRFLKQRPRSFRGYNNLGMALYSNDKLRSSIEAFETALALEPFDRTIKNNLKRALRFQVTILRENKDYATAIEHLERVKKLTDLMKKEKVALKIETLQDLIYQQVKLANTLEDYEAFVAKYPDNPKNADEARSLIVKMKPQDSSLGAFPGMLSERLPDPSQRTTSSRRGVIVSEPIQSVSNLPNVRRESIEIVAQTKQPEEVEEFSKEIQELITEEEKPAPIQQPLDDAVAVNPDMEMKRERSTPLAQAASSTRRVRIVTKVAPLRVRAKPDARSKVLAQIPKNTIVLVFQEAKDWFQVEYQKGKKGWISKKFSQLVN